MLIGERIAILRREKGMTQNELGKIIGVTGVTIMRYEKNQRQLSISTLQKIATALDTTVEELLAVNIQVNIGAQNKYIGSLMQKKYNGEKLTAEEEQQVTEYINSDVFKAALKSGFGHNISTTDLLPDEFNSFSVFIESVGYHVELDNGQYYIAKGKDKKAITVDELKRLVRSSKATIRALLEDWESNEGN